jgi:hypothetical protein
MFLSRKAAILGGAAALSLVLVTAGVTIAAVASIPDSSGLVHGCYKTTAAKNGTHALYVINAATTSACPSGYTSLNWNVNGPNGYSVQASDVHLNDTYTELASLTLPAGSYVLNADAWLENTSPSDTSSVGDCELALGSATDEVEAGLLGPSSTPLNYQTLSMTVAATVTGAASATLSCEAIGDSGETYDATASMTVVQVGSLNP